ncbi:MAG: hypothetical protein AAGG68_02720 [Bacteroidota bacterium]
MKNSSYTFLFILFLPFFLQAQSSYEAATIYLNDGSKQEGFINRTDFKRIGEEVEFKTSLDSESSKHTINSIDGFKFKEDGLEFIKTNFHTITINKYGEETKIPLQRFSKVLLQSNSINIYKVELNRNDYNFEILGSKDYLYVVAKNKDTLQLDVLKGEKNGTALVASKRYKGKLKYIFAECPNLDTENVSFKDNSIINAVREYYECIGSQEESKVVSSNRKLIVENRVGLFAGISEYKLKDHSYYGFSYTSTLFSPEVSRKLGATIGLGMTYQEYLLDFFQLDVAQLHFKVDLLLDLRVLDGEKHDLTLQTGLSWFPHINTSPNDLNDRQFNVFSYALLPINIAYDYQSFRFYAGLSRTVDVGLAFRLSNAKFDSK